MLIFLETSNSYLVSDKIILCYSYGFFDQAWKDGMTKEEAEQLVVKAVSLAIGGVVCPVTVYEQTDDVIFDHLHATAFQYTPLGRTVLGHAENIKKITKKDIEDYASTNYAAHRVEVEGRPLQLNLTAGKADTSRPPRPGRSSEVNDDECEIHSSIRF